MRARTPSMEGFYRLKCWVTESFYEYILEEGSTAVQSVHRCLYEYGAQLSGGGPEALTVYSTLFYRLARCAEKELPHFRQEIGEMDRLWASEARLAFCGEALEELSDEIDWIHRFSC